MAMQGSGISGVDVGSATIKLSDEGFFNLSIGAADMGTGCDTILAQMAAECMECNLDDVAVFGADSDASPYDSGSYASSTTYVTGKAVEKACAELKERLCAIGAELLDCSLERLEGAHAMGVRAVNPTWNHVNALSGTNAEEPERGLTPQGRVFVRKMERLGMLVDVSHLSDPGFWDVAEELSGPFFASHSNARAVFSHPRNLTDEQFTAIIDHNGVVGLNLYANFLGERADLDTAIAHLEHWLELGGERTVALGGDLDGCSSLPEGITGIQDLDRLWERLLQRNYSEALVRALFFENLMRVVSEVCTM